MRSRRITARPLAARQAEKAIVWPYDSFGAPGAILSQSQDKELGTTTVVFANGTRLMVKHTTFEKDKIRVSVSLGQGRKGPIRRWPMRSGRWIWSGWAARASCPGATSPVGQRARARCLGSV
jgi:hypothetical protein